MIPSFSFNRRNAIFLLFCVGGLFVLVLAGMIPLFQEKRQVAAEIEGTRRQLADQERMADLLQALDARLAGLATESPIPMTPRAPIPRAETGTVAVDLKGLAARHALAAFTVDPLLGQIGEDWSRLKIAAEFRGSPAAIRGFLFDVLQLPYLNGISTIEIASSEGGLNLRMLVTIDIN